MELFPAIVIGGPPNSGKSTLTYNLTRALRQRGVLHYVLRAAPDGEGDWANEADQQLVRTILAPSPWSVAFVEHICQSLAQRHLPLIVDAGGRPADWQEVIFDHCTHAVLLTPDEASQAEWQARAARHNLVLLADLRSALNGFSTITATSPTLTGTMVGLQRGAQVNSLTFVGLVERLAHLFNYDPATLRRYHLTSAPVETTVDLDQLAHTLQVPFAGEQAVWQPGHLPAVRRYLPQGQPLGLYGRGPNWLYAAVARQTHPAPFYQFDVRLGWVTPPPLRFGLPAAEASLQVEQRFEADRVELTFTIPGAYLDYDAAAGLTIPAIPPGRGLILNGKLPHWLITALALAYHEAPLLAVYQPQAGRVVVRSDLAGFGPGDLLEDFQ